MLNFDYPIENIWEYIDQRVRKETFTNLDQLWDRVLKIWNPIPIEVLQRHVDSGNIDRIERNILVESQITSMIRSKGNTT